MLFEKKISSFSLKIKATFCLKAWSSYDSKIFHICFCPSERDLLLHTFFLFHGLSLPLFLSTSSLSPFSHTHTHVQLCKCMVLWNKSTYQVKNKLGGRSSLASMTWSSYLSNWRTYRIGDKFEIPIWEWGDQIAHNDWMVGLVPSQLCVRVLQEK